jgi:hypothetical protein
MLRERKGMQSGRRELMMRGRVKHRGNGGREREREKERERELTCASRDIASSGMDSPAPSAARSDNIFSAANTMPER